MSPMGQIHLSGMEFYAFHGHFEEENIIGNRFVVDLVIETDMEIPSMTDNLKDTVNYQTAYQIVQREMEKKSRLLEHIAGRILDALYKELRGIQKATVTVSKLNPPVGGKVQAVRVTLSR
ncbi:MAG: dihydroneopterin aldolase [Bacteroidales bacterium]